jgi:hypothetical protein
MILIIDALLWGIAVTLGDRDEYVYVGKGTKLAQGVLCILNVIAIVILLMR